MRISFSMDPSSLDSRKNADPCTSTFHFLIYEGLTRIRPDGEAELALAQSVDVSEDGKTYLFHLRDATWTDGAPLTAHDFEYSWKKTLTPAFASPCPYLLYPIKNAEKVSQGLLSPDEVGVKALDNRTLKVELENPTPYFLSLITFCNFYPIPRHVELKNPTWSSATDRPPITSGPFRIIKWERNQAIALEKNSTYWDAKNVHLDEIHVSIVPNNHTALQMFEKGELDFLGTMINPLTSEDLSYCRKKGRIKIFPVGAALFCTFNLDQFPFNNADIRKALSFAIDRTAIVNNLTQLSEIAATRCIPPVLDRKKNVSLFPAFDPDLARQHLKKGLHELGIDEQALSRALVLSYTGDGLLRQIAQTIQQHWKTVLGLDAKLFEADRKTTMSKHMTRNYAVGIDQFHAQYYDPNNILERFKHKKGPKNLPGFENPQYIYLLDEASRTSDPSKRMEILAQAEALLMNEMPLAPLFYINEGILMNDKFENVEFSPLGNLLIKNLVPKKAA